MGKFFFQVLTVLNSDIALEKYYLVVEIFLQDQVVLQILFISDK